ncbi:hypothetical protein B9Z55_000565 [Caenorhabditis nigoni]|uniref:Uncharacterized protein n=1 Tax=Caenorhabditis nigoni TaxID=1611254 RepID=A0A2G5VTP8_9PELO|nr:hypothetical protein B9Z55_000565 [Caenorhabditis nigoni]
MYGCEIGKKLQIHRKDPKLVRKKYEKRKNHKGVRTITMRTMAGTTSPTPRRQRGRFLERRARTTKIQIWRQGKHENLDIAARFGEMFLGIDKCW